MSHLHALLFWPLIGALTAVVAAFTTTPLWLKNRKIAYLIAIALPLAGVGLYLWGGNPELIH